jgi:hypothetical protein
VATRVGAILEISLLTFSLIPKTHQFCVHVYPTLPGPYIAHYFLKFFLIAGISLLLSPYMVEHDLWCAHRGLQEGLVLAVEEFGRMLAYLASNHVPKCLRSVVNLSSLGSVRASHVTSKVCASLEKPLLDLLG